MKFTKDQTIARMVYKKVGTGETKVYEDLVVEEVHDKYIKAMKPNGDVRNFRLENIKSA